MAVPISIPSFTVSGLIYDQFNAPVANAKVEVFDKDLRSEQLLGNTNSDTKGHYSITFSSSAAIARASKTPDVFIRVSDSTGKPLGQTPVYFNIPKEVAINLQITSIDDFTSLINIIQPVIAGGGVPNIKDLKEDDGYDDIHFLVSKTEMDAGKIRMLIKAHQLEDKYNRDIGGSSGSGTDANAAANKISSAFFYALLHEGFKILPDTLPNISATDLKNIFIQAIEKKIIGHSLTPIIDATVKRLGQLRTVQILKDSTPANDKFKTAFAPVFPTVQLQHEFLEEYLNNGSTPDKFWNNLLKRPGFTDGKVSSAAKRILQINLFIGNQPELAAQLYKDQSPNGEWSLRDLSNLTKEDWKLAIRKASVKDFPANITGNSNDENIERYATFLNYRVNERYPVEVFIQRLKGDNSPHWVNVKNDLVIFLQNNPSFNLKTNSIKKSIAQADFNGISNSESVKQELKAYNHLNKLSNDFSDISELRKEKIGSAIDIITKYSKNAFKGTFKEVIGEEKAGVIFEKAKQVDTLATAIAVNYKIGGDIEMNVLGKAGSASADYRKWFGTGSQCDCDECQSVYSPTAYFTDIMRFLRDHGNPNEDNPSFQSHAFDRLMEVETIPDQPKRSRRTDLQNIQLTCQNFNTVLPYIDLVNELLEKEVIKASSIQDTEGILSPDHSYQTEGTIEELASIPEHINTNAYTALTTVDETLVLSAALPMDLPLEEIRMYCAKLGFQRYELMEHFYGLKTPGKYKDITIATELLQFSPAEWKVINGESAFTISDPIPQNVAELLKLVGLSYIELCQILECHFISPVGVDNEHLVRIVQPIQNDSVEGSRYLSCDPEELQIIGMDPARIKKLVLFLRIYRKLGWPLFELDRILTAFGVNEFPATPEEVNSKILLPLSHIFRIHKRLNIPLRLATVLFGNIDTRIYKDQSKEGQPERQSLYQQLFRNKAITNPLDAAFKETGPDPLENISSHLNTIGAAFEVSHADLKLLFHDNEKLSLEALSRIYRFILLSKSLKVSISELNDIIKLTGLDFFNASDSSALLDFLDQVNKIRASNFTINELNFSLRHITDKSFQGPSTERIAISLFDIRKDLKKLKSENGANEENRASEFKEKAEVAVADLLAGSMDIDNPIVHSLLTKMLLVPDDPDEKKIISLFTSDEFVNSTVAATIDLATMITERFPELGKSWVILYKTSYLLKKLQLQSDEIDWLFDNRELLNISYLWNLSISTDNPLKIDSISNLFCLPELRKTNPDSDLKWYDIPRYAKTNENTAKKNLIEAMSELYAVPESSLVFLLGGKEDRTQIGQMNARFNDDYINQAFIFSVITSCQIMKNLGASKEQLESIINEGPVTSDAQAARNVLKAKFNSTEWLKIIRPISDQLREKRRDGLLNYLVAKKPDVFPDYNAVFAWLLIDTEMDACMITSRGKQAISSVQLYVERCMMGLEGNITLDKAFARQWEEWRNRYALWGANRMIFISPENWILPELRRNKSPFFTELESKLLQNEITDEAAGDALKEYLEKLDEVARLNISCVYKENNEDGEIIHLLGRTKDIPCKYFYRNKVNKIWQPWEKVEVDIQGDHILMFVHNKQLQLAWAIFNQKQVTNDTYNVPEAGEPIEIEKYWEVKMAYSYYNKGRWTSKKMFKEAKHWNSEEGKTVIRLDNSSDFIQFKIYKSEHGCLTNGIQFFKGFSRQLPPNTARRVSNNSVFPIDFSDPGTEPEIEPGSMPNRRLTGYWAPGGTEFENMEIIESDSSHGKLYSFKKSIIEYGTNLLNFRGNSVELFAKTPGKFIITPSQRESRMLSLDPFGYQDANGSFIVYPSTVSAYDDPDEDSLLTGANIGSYRFENMYYPYSDILRKIYDHHGIDGLYDKEVQKEINDDLFSEFNYDPQTIISKPYPIESFDFSLSGAYSIYNWELFFHIPFLIARHLSNNQKFKEARKWYHYIFNPTRYASEDEIDAERFWISKPFIEELHNGIKTIDEIFGGDTPGDILDQVKEWENNPFDPHIVASMRPAAYMRAIIMHYIDNLIAWGDQLFKTNTLETINEATLLYVMAGNILGKQPEKIPATEQPEVSTFKSIADGLDPLAGIKVEIATNISVEDENSGTGGDPQLLMPLFNIPKNKQLLSKWDIVADRLFKIRHCQNIEGIIQQLPLFEKILDPALLVRAKTLGLDINRVLREIEIPLPNYRFQVMLQKANELCNDVKGLGNALLSVLEKKDAEELALLRSRQELNILFAMKDIKKSQRDEAVQNLESLNKTKETIEFRKEYYLSRPYTNAYEDEYKKSLDHAEYSQYAASAAELIASTVAQVPDGTLGAWSFGFTYGGNHLGASAKSVAAGFGALANYYNNKAAKANASGSYERRSDDWKFQAQSADLELKQIDKQILAAEIRLALAERDLEIHDQQIDNAREVNNFMHDKYTNLELYNWMQDQVSHIYFQSYHMAYDSAKKAEKCLRHELGLEGTNFVQFGYWDNLKKGLLSGEKLQYDVRRLENAYLEENKREYEIVKHVSMIMLDPIALIMLRETGACVFDIPEVLYDMDHPGHYFRRLKSVSISLPCIAGPYTSVSADLRLIESKCRIHKDLSEESLKIFGKDQSISTSNAQNDSGVFELNFRDERYVPFEGTGAISSWRLELPVEVRQFDYNTISDVIIHVKYTAREGGSGLKTLANAALKNQLASIKQGLDQNGLHIAINMKHDLTNEWHLLNKTGSVDLLIDKSRFPYMVQPFEAEIESVMFLAKITVNPADADNTEIAINVDGVGTNLTKVDELKLFRGINSAIELGTEFTISVSEDDKGKLEELIMVVKYRFNL